jgi:hypothetical protein
MHVVVHTSTDLPPPHLPLLRLRPPAPLVSSTDAVVIVVVVAGGTTIVAVDDVVGEIANFANSRGMAVALYHAFDAMAGYRTK